MSLCGEHSTVLLQYIDELVAVDSNRSIPSMSGVEQGGLCLLEESVGGIGEIGILFTHTARAHSAYTRRTH